MSGLWRPLHAELGRWQEAGRVADFWLRDDDATQPSAALDRLLALTGEHAIPLTLAVIPAHAEKALAERLSKGRDVDIAVHGWAHANHAREDEKRQELGEHRPLEAVLAELAEAKATVDRLFGNQALPLLVPPWNRIGRTILPSLAGLGYAALSVYGRAKPAPLHVINTHIDPIDWHGGRGSRDHGELIAALVEELHWRLDTASSEPIGFLTHHLVHDEAVWLFLEQLFEATARQRGCRWVSVRELV